MTELELWLLWGYPPELFPDVRFRKHVEHGGERTTEALEAEWEALRRYQREVADAEYRLLQAKKAAAWRYMQRQRELRNGNHETG